MILSTESNFSLYIKSSIGNAIEWYDFCLYGYFASLIGPLYFPSSDPDISLLSAFSVFTAGFLARPLGGLIFGYIGDIRGRYYAMNIAIVCMSIATFLMAILPDYSQIGLLAPCLLIALRIIQGISAGGQYGNLITITSEGNTRYRGFYFGCAYTVSICGVMLASLVSQLALSQTPASLQSHAWRLPFLLSGLLLILQLYCRPKEGDIQDQLVVQRYRKKSDNPLYLILRNHLKPFLLVIALVTCGGSLYYLLYSYMATYMTQFLGVSLSQALRVTALSQLIGILATPLFGLLGDFFNRKKMLLAGFITFLIVFYPIMNLLWMGYLYTSMALLSIFLSWLCGLTTPAYFEIFPHQVRATGCSLGNGAGAAFCGCVPLIAASITTLYHYHHLAWLYACLLVSGVMVTLLLPGSLSLKKPLSQSHQVPADLSA